MILVIIAGAILIGAIGTYAIARRGIDCPRVILGYNCKGNKCDHSMLAIEHARRTVEGR